MNLSWKIVVLDNYLHNMLQLFFKSYAKFAWLCLKYILNVWTCSFLCIKCKIIYLFNWLMVIFPPWIDYLIPEHWLPVIYCVLHLLYGRKQILATWRSYMNRLLWSNFYASTRKRLNKKRFKMFLKNNN